MKPLIAQLDHSYLNEIAGLENPTIENMAAWFWEKLAPQCPGLCEIVIHETPTARCVYRGELVVIPSEVEGSRGVPVKVASRDPSTSLGMPQCRGARTVPVSIAARRCSTMRLAISSTICSRSMRR